MNPVEVKRITKTVIVLAALGYQNQAFAIIDPGSVAFLSAIAGYTAQTVQILKSTSELLEVGHDLRSTLSESEDDLDSLSELFEEINPSDGSISLEQRKLYESLAEENRKFESLDDTIKELDSIKWSSRYLKSRMERSNPKRLSAFAKNATRAIRIGKKLARLLPKTHEEETAKNTEIIRGQNYAMGRALLDIRSEIRASNERQVKQTLDGTLNTAVAVQQLQDAAQRKELK